MICLSFTYILILYFAAVTITSLPTEQIYTRWFGKNNQPIIEQIFKLNVQNAALQVRRKEEEDKDDKSINLLYA